MAWWPRGALRTFAAMTAGARTPEELDALLEDAFVLRDREAFRLLFAEDALLAEAGGLEARGEDAIGCALDGFCAADRLYVARPGRVLPGAGDGAGRLRLGHPRGPPRRRPVLALR